MKDEAYLQFAKWLAIQPYWLQDAAWKMYKIISNWKKTCFLHLKKTRNLLFILDASLSSCGLLTE